MSAAVSCPNCGEALHEGEQACSRCGMSIAVRLTCAACGAPFKPTDSFCGGCGAHRSDPSPYGATLLEEVSPWEEVLGRLRKAMVGEFEILRELGRGGMAAVYLAHDLNLNCKVAIKVMSPMLFGTGTERFRMEGVTVANLNHPHIVTIHARRQAAGLHFLVMKLIPGASVEQLIREVRPLPIPVIQALAFQVGSALHYAHTRGVVHRDVKPSNILMDEDGRAVVTDFGIAKVREVTGHTLPGTAVGTPVYMSPEQCRFREATSASDQYSLGIVLYEMLTGAAPFRGTMEAILRAHEEDLPQPISFARPDCPPSVAEVVHRMLAKDPGARWPSTMKAVEALGGRPVAEGDPMQETLIELSKRGRQVTTDELRTPRSPIMVRPPEPKVNPPPEPPPKVEAPDEIKVRLRPQPAPVPVAVTPPSPPVRIPGLIDQVVQVVARLPHPRIMAAAAGVVLIVAVLALLWPKPDHPRVASLVIIPAATSVKVGETVSLGVRLSDSAGRALTGRRITWSAGDGSYAKVSPAGVVTGHSPGRALIRGETEGVTGTASVVVISSAVPVVRVELSQPPSPMEVGDSFTMTVTARDSGGGAIPGQAVSWNSSRPSVATISRQGDIVAVGAGRSTITAKVGQQVGSVIVTVLDLRVAEVRVTPLSMRVAAGDSARLRAQGVDSRGKPLGGVVIWESIDESVAKVTPNGWVIGVAPGTTEVGATSGGVRGAVAVTVAPKGRDTGGAGRGGERATGIAVLRLLVSPWANLSIDGVSRGQRNRGADTVTAGVQHALRFERPGFQTVDTSVTLRPGEQRLLRIQMIRRAP